jgi:hypothetical protein
VTRPETTGGGFQLRKKTDWQKLGGLLTAAVDYSNFKAEVHQRLDQVNKNRAYAEVWATMYRVQVEDSTGRIKESI